MSDDNNISVWDHSTAVRLGDVGGGRWELVEGIRGDGDRRYWLLNPDRAHEGYHIVYPSHELVGPLPEDILNRINQAARMADYWKCRCGAETATTGTRCRNRVTGGGRCHRHRVADPAAVDLRGGGAQ